MIGSIVRYLAIVRDQIHGLWIWEVAFLRLSIRLCVTGHKFLPNLCRNKSIWDHLTNVYNQRDPLYLPFSWNKPISKNTHCGYLPNSVSAIRQNRKGKSLATQSVLNHFALLRLVLSWLTVQLWTLYYLYLFVSRLIETVHRQMNVPWQHINNWQNGYLSYLWHYMRHRPLQLL